MSIEILNGKACCEWFQQNVAGIQNVAGGEEATGIRLWWDTTDKKDGMLLVGLVYRGKPIQYCPGCGAEWSERLRDAMVEFVLGPNAVYLNGSLCYAGYFDRENENARSGAEKKASLFGYLRYLSGRVSELEKRVGKE